MPQMVKVKISPGEIAPTSERPPAPIAPPGKEGRRRVVGEYASVKEFLKALRQWANLGDSSPNHPSPSQSSAGTPQRGGRRNG
jgi:hypothetical protein